MFAAIYQFYILPGCEEEARDHWRTIASYFLKTKGALGSCLHREDNGLWVAYSRWPSKEIRDAAWPGDNEPSTELPFEIRQAIEGIKKCSDPARKIPELSMEVMDDLL